VPCPQAELYNKSIKTWNIKSYQRNQIQIPHLLDLTSGWIAAQNIWRELHILHIADNQIALDSFNVLFYALNSADQEKAQYHEVIPNIYKRNRPKVRHERAKNT